jgi:hypothetical protein
MMIVAAQKLDELGIGLFRRRRRCWRRRNGTRALRQRNRAQQ